MRGAGGVDRHGTLPTAGTLTTTLNPHPGGASVQVHARENGAFRLLFEAVVAGGVVETGVRAGGEKGTAAPEPAPTELSGRAGGGDAGGRRDVRR